MPEIGTNAFELFFLTCLTGVFFSLVTLAFMSSSTSFFVLSTPFSYVQVMELLASSYILSLFQDKSILTNSTLLLKSELKLLLESIT